MKNLDPAELYEKLRSYAVSGGIRMQVSHGGFYLHLTVPNASNEAREAIGKAIEPFVAGFDRVDIYQRSDERTVSEFLNRIDFLGIKHALSNCIRLELEALASHAQQEPIYAFAISFSANHGYADIHWNTESAWERKKKKFLEAGCNLYEDYFPGSKYLIPEFKCECLESGGESRQSLDSLLEDMTSVASEYFDLTGGEDAFNPLMELGLEQAATQALRECDTFFSGVPRTNDFLYYAQNYITGTGNLLSAMETIDESTLKRMFPKSLKR
jgi:hypothetical protein